MSRTQAPLISVLLVVRDVQATIARTVESILDQTLSDFELIILDDGSTDGTLPTIAAFRDDRIRVIADDRWLGLATRLNQGLDQAQGEFVARMDGDDIAYPQRFERQLTYLREHPEVDLVGASVIVFRGDGTVLGVRKPPQGHGDICRGVHGFSIAHPTYFGRAKWFRQFRYAEDMRRSQDQDLLLRAHFSSRLANVPEILLGYREETVSMQKAFAGRRDFTRSIVRIYGSNGAYHRALEGLVVQSAKLAIDGIAALTGSSAVLLKHRATAASQVEIDQWANVWAQVTRALQERLPYHATPGTSEPPRAHAAGSFRPDDPSSTV